MPPGIIADINSVSARQRDSVGRAPGGGAAAGDIDGVIRPGIRSVQPASGLAFVRASHAAKSSISTPHYASCSIMERPCSRSLKPR